MLESSLTVVRFSWANQNSFAAHSNQRDCFIIDNRLHQMTFLCLSKWAGCGPKTGFQVMLKDFEIKKLFLW